MKTVRKKPGPKKGHGPAKENLVNGRTRANLRLCGFPAQLLRDPIGTKAKAMKIIAELKEIEEQLCKWEDSQPEWFLELLPWWEDRKEYRRQKALGIQYDAPWWEVAHWADEIKPCRVEDPKNWGLYVSPKRAKQRLRARLKREERAKKLALKSAS